MRTLALVVLVIAVGCSGDDGSAAASSTALMVTNGFRQMDGKPPLAESSALITFASAGAADDFASTPHHHFTTTNGGGIAFAENECPHWSLAHEGAGDMDTLVTACITAFYNEGPGSDYAKHGHYINMMGNYQTMGLGIHLSGDDATLVEDFGN